MKRKPALAYNKFQKLNYFGRFGPLFGMPLVGMAIDNSISLDKLSLILGLSNFLGFLIYVRYMPLKKPNIKPLHLIWLFGTFLHAGGMHFLFLLANIFQQYRATILLMSSAVNGLGTFIIIFFIEQSIALEIDSKKGHHMFLINQIIRSFAHLMSSVFFLIIYFVEGGISL